MVPIVQLEKQVDRVQPVSQQWDCTLQEKWLLVVTDRH